MKVEIDQTNKIDNGWNVKIKVILSSEELSNLNQESITKIEDFNIILVDSTLYFDCFTDTREPWEDEPLEEILKALKFEVEYHVNGLFN